MKIICALVAISLLAWGQDTPPKTTTERRLIQLKYVDARIAGNLIIALAGGNIHLVSDDRLHMLAVNGTTEMVALVEEAVKKLDVPPVDFELTVYLISASSQAGDQLPEGLASTAKQLHGVFAYKGYQLLDSFVLRGRDEGNATADGTIKNSTYTFHYQRASVLDGTSKIINLQGLRLQVRLFTGMDNKGEPVYKTTGLNTDVDIREGQKVVVGKSDVNNGESPLILVVTAKVVE